MVTLLAVQSSAQILDVLVDDEKEREQNEFSWKKENTSREGLDVLLVSWVFFRQIHSSSFSFSLSIEVSLK